MIFFCDREQIFEFDGVARRSGNRRKLAKTSKKKLLKGKINACIGMTFF